MSTMKHAQIHPLLLRRRSGALARLSPHETLSFELSKLAAWRSSLQSGVTSLTKGLSPVIHPTCILLGAPRPLISLQMQVVNRCYRQTLAQSLQARCQCLARDR